MLIIISAIQIVNGDFSLKIIVNLSLENSTTYFLDANDNDIYRFRPKEFLKDNNIDPDILWIVLWINQIYNEIEFNNVKELIIPKIDYINSLYEQYRSFKANLQRSNI